MSILYWAVTYVLTTRKLMWNDELYTYYIARLPTMADVWAALMAGGEQTPPFFYVITRLSFALFGVNNFSLRLPEILGFWVMSLCLFIFVARRASTFYALLAAIFPLVSGAYFHAFDARPYGLVLGFGTLALLCWQSATLNRWRLLSLICLALSLAAAISIHYYGILIIFPLATGEAVRTLTRRRLDMPVWAAFGLAVTPLMWHLPLIKQARAYSGVFWSPPAWVNIPDFYSGLLAPMVLPLAAVLILAGIYTIVFPDDERAQKQAAPSSSPVHEIAAACGFIVIPVICVILAKLATGAFANRYALPAVIGFGVLVALIAAKIFNNRAVMGLALVICFGGWFLLTQAREIRDPTGNSLGPFTSAALQSGVELFQSEREQALPIVAAEPHTLVHFSHYAPPEIASRMVYLADPSIALKRLGHNSVERGMVDLIKPWFGMNVTDYKTFVAEHPRFLVYGNFGGLGFLNWILPELQAENMRVEFRGRSGENLFFLVSRDEGVTASAPARGSEAAPAQ
ncbi:MAG: glycosyltransferase family 39 protein [Acidobacteriota bacterium]|nr:glycosyltransferase family 39 protein [Acidobacteriota bacterium]